MTLEYNTLLVLHHYINGDSCDKIRSQDALAEWLLELELGLESSTTNCLSIVITNRTNTTVYDIGICFFVQLIR